ncbi:28672_t:CDS:2, partial [Dentiscutata erythropus]
AVLRTEKDIYPLPLIEEVPKAFQGARWFSSLDLINGYWQVAVKEEDKKKTTNLRQLVPLNRVHSKHTTMPGRVT